MISLTILIAVFVYLIVGLSLLYYFAWQTGTEGRDFDGGDVTISIFWPVIVAALLAAAPFVLPALGLKHLYKGAVNQGKAVHERKKELAA